MHRLTTAMTVAGTLATGLPLLTEVANAQTTFNWYQFTPLYCEAFVYRHTDGSVSSSLYVNVNLNGYPYNILVPDSPLIGALYKSCTDGSGFWAYYEGPAAGWTTFYTYPGLH
jgi:hypothetical protein